MLFSACTMSSQRKFTFAISSPDEFLVKIVKIFIYSVIPMGPENSLVGSQITGDLILILL